MRYTEYYYKRDLLIHVYGPSLYIARQIGLNYLVYIKHALITHHKYLP